MNFLKVKLWGEEIGRLVWDSRRRTTYFIFNPEMEDRPDVAPLLRPVSANNDILPVYGDERRIYQELPPFIADSLPDSWGNKLFDKWVRQNRISEIKITPLYKLMFIGKRGMGALEYEPADRELERSHEVDIPSLYKLSLDILTERESVCFEDLGAISMQLLLTVGTSAGGRQMKAIIAINPDTGEIRSGQTDGLNDFDYCIIKFEDEVVPTSEIEMAYYDMAVASGINMQNCRLFNIDGTNHFITRRFDRCNGEKIHTQTLAAINPDADSYEELFSTCRQLNLSDKEIIELFRRLVFNVISNNTDDHNKNFSFLLEKGGKWRLAPAYDMTFIFNKYGTGFQPERCLSLYGKLSDITIEDLLEFAKSSGIRNPKSIISKVADSLSIFPELALKYNIPAKWSHIIHKTLHDNLVKFGYADRYACIETFTDIKGSVYSNISVAINTKGIFDVTAVIDGKKHRRFIHQNTGVYESLQRYQTGSLSQIESETLFASIFAG